MRCHECGRAVPSGQLICPHCGASLAARQFLEAAERDEEIPPDSSWDLADHATVWIAGLIFTGFVVAPAAAVIGGTWPPNPLSPLYFAWGLGAAYTLGRVFRRLRRRCCT